MTNLIRLYHEFPKEKLDQLDSGLLPKAATSTPQAIYLKRFFEIPYFSGSQKKVLDGERQLLSMLKKTDVQLQTTV